MQDLAHGEETNVVNEFLVVAQILLFLTDHFQVGGHEGLDQIRELHQEPLRVELRHVLRVEPHFRDHSVALVKAAILCSASVPAGPLSRTYPVCCARTPI